MTLALLSICVALLLAAVVLLVLVLRRSSGSGGAESAMREELARAREETARSSQLLRQEVRELQESGTRSALDLIETMGKRQAEELSLVKSEVKGLADSNETRLTQMRDTMDGKLDELRKSNELKLDEMRSTVDEKLHDTLEKRLGESFRTVSEQLKAVQTGLGEMRTLATGVGDLKKVLSNVKTRGTLGEIQLGSMLEEILTRSQYDVNVRTKEDSGENVEFAVRLPGPEDDPDRCVWLPIDSKFPQEDYQRLVDAAEEGDSDAVKAATTSLVRSVKNCAKDIRTKYISPPATTDFAILFLPTEGLYAEVLRQPGLVDELMRVGRIVVAGPTTLAAILSSLRMGFRTLAIEKRSSEVWQVLAAVKKEFGSFGDVLAKLKKQLETASNTVDKTGVRTRAIERKLRDVEELPDTETEAVLGLDFAVEEAELDEDDR